MKIKICGYKNIEKFEYELKDNKTNVLIGISGSGKSSIAGALSNDNVEFHHKINYKGQFVAEINGDKPDKISIFNDDTIAKYLFSHDKESNMFSVLIDNEKSLSEARKDLDQRLRVLQDLVTKSKPEYDRLFQIQKQLGATLTLTNKIKVTSAISKMRTSMKLLGKQKLYNQIAAMDSNHVQWIVDGVPYIESSICPFCQKKMGTKKERELHKYAHLDVQNQKKINLSTEQLTAMNSSGVQLTLDGLDKLETEVIKMGIALKEYDKLVADIEMLYDYDKNFNKINLDYKNELYEMFPPFLEEISRLNKKVDSLLKNVNKARNKTKEIFSGRLTTINELIKQFGIPFQIEAIYKQGKIYNYRLYHIDDPDKLERGSGLSIGERKIISLIFYILEVSQSRPDLIIFDDPVSSFDESRRLSIFKLITKKLKTQTVLLLSHDQLFAKFAVAMHKNSIGNIDYFDNHGSLNIINITKDDFNNITSYIKNQITNSKSYMQLIINLRFYYEINKEEVYYSYLSEILHKRGVEALVNKNMTSEATIIENLNKKFKISLPAFSYDYYSDIDTTFFTLLEKMMLFRENCGQNKLKEELSNHIHLNSKYIITLNPYRFNFCSKYIYDEVTAAIQDRYSLVN